MRKPKEPNKKITITNYKSYYHHDFKNLSSLEEFLQHIKNNISAPLNSIRVKLFNGTNCECCGEEPASLELTWDSLIDNPDYSKQYKKYLKKLQKYKAENKS